MTDPCNRCGDPEARMFDEDAAYGYGPIPLCGRCREQTLDEIAEERTYQASHT